MTAYPIPPKREFSITQHGVTRRDEYYWMREREDPQVYKYLQEENEYLENVLRPIKPLQEQLFQEMKGRVQEVDSSVPEKVGAYFYYTRTEAGKQYPIFCRKKDSIDSPEEILLDQNLLAEGHGFCSVSAFSVSPDHSKLAYSIDLEGAEIYTVQIKDLASGELYPERIGRVYGSVYHHTGVEWAEDSQTLFYITLDEYHRADKLHRHKLNTDPNQDVLLFHETDDTFSLSLYKTRSRAFLMLHHYNTISQEMRFLPTDQPDSEPRLIQPREPKLEYHAGHHGDFFYILTNKGARNYKLVKAPISASGMENWQEVVPHREDVMLEHFELFENHLILLERRDGLHQLRISQVDGASGEHYVKFPDPTYEVTIATNPEFKSDVIRIRYSSLITPGSIVNIRLDTGKWELLKEDQIPSGYDKTRYVTEFIFAGAKDGKKIPLSIAYKKGLKRDGQNPTLIYGYGAYGGSGEAHFNSNIISILERGFVFVIAHVRGGSEMGHDWYEDGRLLKKRNSFTDLIACAEHLVEEGFTSPEKLAITGSSAGGLLVSASMILRPDLFKVVICKVPFLDVVTSMSDPTIPLTTLEYDQWGNPEESREAFDYMLTYSPYDNIQSVEYPHLLLTTGYNDPRVAYWEPAKFLARLRDKKKGGSLALLQTNFSAGHAGASGRYDFLRENALDFAFLIDRLTQTGD
ncbi:MAG: S9 family peptidase [Anaerolineales bacterium]|nr:MAG: S9 family peptidase [Anaerolineales bacterium]